MRSSSALPQSLLQFMNVVFDFVASLNIILEIAVVGRLISIFFYFTLLGWDVLVLCHLNTKGQRSSLHANGGPVLGRRHKCENKLLSA